MNEKKPHTHVAYALKRESRTDVRFLEIGIAWMDGDGSGRHKVHIDRLPIGGFSGHIHLAPIGLKPLVPEPQPVRPARGVIDDES